MRDSMAWIRVAGVCRIGYQWTRKFVFVSLSALLEKNPTKLLAIEAPIVFSMSRLVVLAFAVAMVRRLWSPGALGWPDVTLSAVVAIALPLVDALRALKPTDVVQFATKIVDKFGAGDVAAPGGGR